MARAHLDIEVDEALSKPIAEPPLGDPRPCLSVIQKIFEERKIECDDIIKLYDSVFDAIHNSIPIVLQQVPPSLTKEQEEKALKDNFKLAKKENGQWTVHGQKGVRDALLWTSEAQGLMFVNLEHQWTPQQRKDRAQREAKEKARKEVKRLDPYQRKLSFTASGKTAAASIPSDSDEEDDD